MAAKPHSDVEDIKESPETQLDAFDRGNRFFRDCRYSEACPFFEQAAAGSIRAVAHNARLHIKMCEQRLAKPQVALRTAEDFYNVGVERLNIRDIEGARENLARAVELTGANGGKADHIYYVFAACCAMAGDVSGAYENLKRAIEIQPKNRAVARTDPDFAALAVRPALLPLLLADRSSSF